MRLLLVTAGAANMYCGSCLRDNTLATELRLAGHDVTLLPLYTPTRTDELNVSVSRVFFGGISVYLQQHVSWLRRTPAALDWLCDRPWLIKAVSGRQLKTDPRLLGGLTLSMLRGDRGHQRKEFEKLLAWLRAEPPYDVAFLPNSLLIALAEPLRTTLQCPVLCTLQGEDLFIDGLDEATRATARDLIGVHSRHVSRFVAVSDYYAEFMATYLGIERTTIVTAPLGIRFDGYRSKASRGGAFTVGYFARIDPAKGLDRLCRAYCLLRRTMGLEAGRLQIAGFMAAEQSGYLKACRAILATEGLEDEFDYRGEVDRNGKVAFLAELDAFSVPTAHAEPKGLFVLEAMASGVPVVAPRRGAFPEMIERTGGGLLVANDEQGIAEGLYRLAADPSFAAELGQRAWEGVRQHYTARRMAGRILEICQDAMSQQPPGRKQPVITADHHVGRS